MTTTNLTLRIAFIGLVSMIVVASATIATVARTYWSLTLLESAFALWDDRQVVVFVHTGNMGLSSAMIDRLQIRANWYPIRPPATGRFAGVTRIVRVEDGVIRHATFAVPGVAGWANDGFLPRFIEGKPLVIGGFWNGSEVERIAPDDYRALTQSEDSEDQTGRWQNGPLMHWTGLPPRHFMGTVDLPVTVRGESMTLRSSLSKSHVSIDLLRAEGTPTRLIDLPLESKVVNKHDFDAMFDPSGTR